MCASDVENVSSLHGAVVEGTFMNPQCHGCHNPKYVLQPNAEVLDKLLNTGAVKTINIAPEVSFMVEIVDKCALQNLTVTRLSPLS